MRIVFIAIGSRGDVQPFVATGVHLKKLGYSVCVATHVHNKNFVEQYGLEFAPVKIDFKEFLRTEGAQRFNNASGNPIRAITGLASITKAFIPYAEKMLDDCLKACDGADAIVSVSLVPGFHIAESKNIPCFLMGPFPVHCTGENPHPYLPFSLGLGKVLNRFSYFIVQNLFWIFFRGFTNRWRERLNLPAIKFPGLYKYVYNKKFPFFYTYSLSVIKRGADYPSWAHCPGYLFLDEPEGWSPPKDLLDFLEDGPSPVYIGFGSMSDKEPEKLTEIVVKALEITGQRGILVSGWGGLRQSDFPDSIFCANSIPHSWLFPKMTAIVHHGGAGTTGAALRAGVPSLVIPFLADQFFWGNCVSKLKVGPPLITRKKLTPENLAEAINTMVNDQEMRFNAREFGLKIQTEKGLENMAAIMEQYLGSTVLK